MRKKNGFTLVEIISVIGILLLIAAVAIPSIITINKRNKEKNYQKIVESIKDSSEIFVEEYRSDIPFNETSGEYYFRLNVLGALNLVKLPIKDPRNDSNIDGNSCIKVKKQDDGSLSYEFGVDSTKCVTIEPTLTVTPGDQYVKKGNNINLEQYATYSSNTTPKKYLKLNIVGDIQTNIEGSYEVTYSLIDLLNGTASSTQNKTFIVMDNQNINVVFLSDSVTKQDRDATDLESWKTEVENKFKNDERFKNTGIEFNVNVKKVDTNPPSLQLNYIGELYGGTTDLKEVNYKGVFGNFIVAESKNSFSVAGSSTTSYTTLLRNVNTQEAQFLEGGSCRHANNVLYCYKHEGGYDLLNYGYGVTTYYKYVFNNSTNKYDNSIIAQSAWNYNPYSGTTTYSYSPSQTVYNEIANDYSSASSDLNTHVNPNGLTYKTNSEMLNLLKKYNPSWTTKEASMYKYDTYNNVFIDNEKGIGYLLFTKGSGTASGYLWAYILWENEIENFLIDLNNYPNFNKTYLVITANNTNNYQQKLNIANSNDSVQTYLYGDSNTLNNFNITNKSSYADFNTILTNLKNQINY